MLVVRLSRRDEGIEIACTRDDAVLSTHTYTVGAEALDGALACIGVHQRDEVVAVEVLGRGVIGASKERSVIAALLRSHLCFS